MESEPTMEASLTATDATLHTACICFIGLCQNPAVSQRQISEAFSKMFHPDERQRARLIIRSLISSHPIPYKEQGKWQTST